MHINSYSQVPICTPRAATAQVGGSFTALLQYGAGARPPGADQWVKLLYNTMEYVTKELMQKDQIKQIANMYSKGTRY